MTLGSRCMVSSGSREERRELCRSDGDRSLREKASMKGVSYGNCGGCVGEEDSGKSCVGARRDRAVNNPIYVLRLETCEEGVSGSSQQRGGAALTSGKNDLGPSSAAEGASGRTGSQ